MSTAQINGIRLYYEVHGDGPAVVLSHGLGSNHLHWWQQVAELAKTYKVITFDHRGFGFSTDDGQGPTAFVQDLLRLLDYLKIERTALVGQSMGGFTVAGVASLQPERVAALVLSSSSAGLVASRPPPERLRGRIAAATDYQSLAHVLIHQDGFPERKPTLCLLCEQMAQLNQNVNIRVLSQLATIRHNPLPIVTANIPILLIGSEEDVGARAAMTEIETMFAGSASLTIVPNTGHLLFFEDADSYNRLLSKFLAETLLVSPPGKYFT